MKKKILIGSIIAVALLLLMPSIPAIQQKTIEDKAYSDLVEQLEDIKVLDRVKHPLLYVLVMIPFFIRYLQCYTLLKISTENWSYLHFDIIHPLLFCWFLWSFLTIIIYRDFWLNLSDTFGWDWNIPT